VHQNHRRVVAGDLGGVNPGVGRDDGLFVWSCDGVVVSGCHRSVLSGSIDFGLPDGIDEAGKVA
jgi:hypothetical protein